LTFQALRCIQSAVDVLEVFDPARSERRFTLYMSDLGQLVLVPRLLRMLEERAPHWSVAVVDVPARLAPARMIEGSIASASASASGSFTGLEAVAPRVAGDMGGRVADEGTLGEGVDGCQSP
jgi:hypothetical protein